jgi:nucleoside-diphosphate-sugar epimerase
LIHHRPTPEPPARVVVLGASGFVASELLEHLAGLRVETLGIPSSKVDLRDPASAAVLHDILRPDDALVFVSSLTPDRGRDIRTLMTNLAMADHVCAALDKASCAHVVYVSSDAVYADEINPVRETSWCDPSGFHGLMHLARERMLIPTLKRSKTPLLLLRPSLLFGARDTHNGYGPNRFLRTALSERTIALFGGGEEKRDHVYVKDLSRLIGLTLLHRTEGVLNAATGRSRSFFDVARVIADRLGGGVRVETTARQNPITHRHFDVTIGLKAFPGFRYTPIEEALSEVITEVQGKPRGETG